MIPQTTITPKSQTSGINFDLRRKSKSPDQRQLMSLNQNKQTMVKSIQDVILAGQLSEQMKIQKRELLSLIYSNSSNDHMVILLKGYSKSMITRYGFSALYQLKLQKSDYDTGKYALKKIYGKTSTLSPIKVDEGMIEKFFKYSSAQTKFVEITN